MIDLTHIYHRLATVTASLPDGDAGAAFRAVAAYALTGQEPTGLSALAQMAFDTSRYDIDRLLAEEQAQAEQSIREQELLAQEQMEQEMEDLQRRAERSEIYRQNAQKRWVKKNTNKCNSMQKMQNDANCINSINCMNLYTDKEKETSLSSPTPLTNSKEKENNPQKKTPIINDSVKEKVPLIESNLADRRQHFYNQVAQFAHLYPPNMLRAFFDYWTEPNRSMTKMRYEMQKTFAINLRLANWAKHETNYTNKPQTPYERQQRNIQQYQNDTYDLMRELVEQDTISLRQADGT